MFLFLPTVLSVKKWTRTKLLWRYYSKIFKIGHVQVDIRFDSDNLPLNIVGHQQVVHCITQLTYPKSAGELLVVVVVLRAQQLKKPEHAVSFWELSHLLELWLNSFTEILRLYWRQHRFWHKLLQSHLQIVQQQYVIFVLNRKLQMKLCKQQMLE